jgi:hypothetical protein
MRKLISILTLALFAVVCLAADAPEIAGKWQFVLEMPHGNRAGVLTLQPDGPKLSGACELEKHGSSTVTGSIQGAKVSMKIELHGGSFTLLGTVEADNMSGTTEPAGGTWKATRQKE